MDWVIDKIKEGYVDVANPFYPSQVSRVSLKPKDVKFWMWWSKNFKQWIEYYQNYTDIFKSYKGHGFQFTINSPSELEGNVKISLDDRIKQLEWLVDEFGTIAMNYRFDPIIFYKQKDSNTIKNNLSRFEYIIEKISSLGLNEMIFSFATMYSKVERRMKARGYLPIDPDLNKKKEILERLKGICDKNNMVMKACCQPELITIEGIEQSYCIDSNRIEKIIGESVLKAKDTGQRKNCGCNKSKDIGSYRGIFKCGHNCSYCYASPAKK
jgi:DNA repair photolyase